MSQAVTSEEAKKLSTTELLQRLESDKTGLASLEAEKRLQQFGPNKISEKKISPLIRFLRYFRGPIPWMIETAAVLSALIQHWTDLAIILSLLLLNAIVGFWQERSAGNAVELLKRRLALKARVLRDGRWGEVSAEELVPGDVVRLRLGDVVPADVKLLEGDYLLVDQSALTGESLPVEKHASDLGYSGSVVRRGEMTALVVTTGMNTYFGRTARLAEEAKTQSHFQRAVIKIGDYLIVLAVALMALIFLMALFRRESLLDALQFALVLAVAAIPAALPAVLSVTMAVGALALARREAIVSKLVSIEEMAGVDVLCADKTGTITKNQISVAQVRALNEFRVEDVLLFAALASREEDQDPIDNAVIKKTKTQESIVSALSHYRVTSFKPFNSVTKRAEATVADSAGNSFRVAKGAPQVILLLTGETGDVAADVDETVSEFAARGNRALGVAKTDEAGKWRYVGLIALYDAPREDSTETIKTAQKMGLRVKMVTGDHIAIAREIAREIGLGANIYLPALFLKEHDRDAQQIVEEADGFAEVLPEHKYHIVELLQSRDHIVAMTGDGVNDVPALKKADVGIAVSGATDAAKSAAAIVLTEPGLSVIIDAVKESRKIFQRMSNYATYRVAETIRVLLFITASIIVFQFYPVTALMIVLLAILNDIPVITIAYDNVRYSDEPERWNMLTVLGIATFLGVIGVASSFGLLYIGLDVLNLSPTVLQSFIYLKLSVAGHLTIFVARTKGYFWSVKPAKQLLTAVAATQLVATLITVYGFLLPAMGWELALLVWVYALTMFLVTDFLKVRLYGLLDNRGLMFKR